MKKLFVFFMCLFVAAGLQAECQVISPEDIWDNSYIPCDPTGCYPSSACPVSNYCCEPCTWSPVDNFNAGYSYGEGIEVKQNYAFAELMAFPFYTFEGKVPFIQLGAYRLSDNKYAGSVGLGMRWQQGCGSCNIYGINVFYDIRNCDQGTYNQVGAGIESLSKQWEWRINGYMPVGNTNRMKAIKEFDDYTGGFFIKVRRIEQAEYGGDAEVGRNLYYRDHFRFYIAAGAGYFAGSYSKNGVWAFKARSYLEICRFLKVEVRTFKETHERWHCQGLASLSIPFECFYNFYRCGMSDLYSQPVYRNAMIKKYTKCCWITNF